MKKPASLRLTCPGVALALFAAPTPAALPIAPLPIAPLPIQDGFVNWETPHVSPLALTPDRTRLLAVNLPDNRLEVFDVTSGTPVWQRSIPVGLDPVSVRARTDSVAWVVNQLSDSVSVVDLVAGRVVATLQTDDEPADVVFAGGRAFVSCSQANTLLDFDPLDLTRAPLRIAIRGEDPRAMAVSPDGTKVYVAIFESGNRTTVIGNGGFVPFDFPFNVVGLPTSPHGGANPPPNDPPGFAPPIGPTLPVPPSVAQIVKDDGTGKWLDDSGADWSNFINGPQSWMTGRVPGWTIMDHDLAILDLTTFTLSYADHLMNLCMALAVDPATGTVAVVGTDATNDVRFESNLNGRFLRVQLARVDPAQPATPVLGDLNPHLDYQSSSVAPALRDQTISDPRGIVWKADGSRAYVSGMGTNNVVVLGANGLRAGLSPTIPVGAGPTGLVLDEARERLYVLNRFEATISVIHTGTETELGRVAFHDPTPALIKRGRPHLYDARATSGLGLTSCASCHVDARMDRLAWDLGNPQGEMQGLEGINHVAEIPNFNTGFVDFHPMKGPMLTQSLQDIIGHEPFHWRGEKAGLENFNPAFQGVLGDEDQLSAEEMQDFERFLATVVFPPNPYRQLDNSLSRRVSMDGMHTPGRFQPAGLPLPDGDATNGLEIFLHKRTVSVACINCHTLPTGEGTNWRWNGSAYEEIPLGAQGQRHLAVFPAIFQIEQNIKIPSLRNLYERTGCDGTVAESGAGFGFRHDGSIDSLPRFVARPHFSTQNDQEVADLVAFLLSMSGGIEVPPTDLANLDNPPGTPFQATHAAVGRQVTIADGANPSAAALALLNILLGEAQQGDIGLVARGRLAGLERGWYWVAGEQFQSDRRGERATRAALLASAGPGSELTFTAVPRGTERRIGADRDADGALDRDELDRGFDPADARSRPKVQRP